MGSRRSSLRCRATGLAAALAVTASLLNFVGGGVTRPATGAPDAAAPRWALLVGIDKFQGRTQELVGSVGDVRDLEQSLLKAGWPRDHILTLTDSGATAASIRNGLRWLAANATDGAFSVFHYSGHVKQIAGDRDRDGEDLDEYIWPHDNAHISDGELGVALRQVRGSMWASLNGCEGAGLDDGVSGPNRLVTASSHEHEKSYEDPTRGNTVMGMLLFDQAFIEGQGDTNKDGLVSIHEAFKWAERDAPRYTARQAKGPQHPVLRGGDGREWFLRAPAPPPKASPPPPDDDTCLFGICFT